MGVPSEGLGRQGAQGGASEGPEGRSPSAVRQARRSRPAHTPRVVQGKILFIMAAVRASMHLVSGRVRHYRSIGDSGPVGFDPEITGIVGAAGSGKTSFLRMLSGVSSEVRFGEGDLPHNSDVLARFHDGIVNASEIVQLEAVFQVEDVDVPRLPQACRHASQIAVRRTFDGNMALAVDGSHVPRADIRDEAGEMLACASRVAALLPKPGSDQPAGNGSTPRTADDAASGFGETDFYSKENTLLAIQSLRTAAHSAPRTKPVMIKLEEEFDKMESIRQNMERKIAADPSSALYGIIPKPKYCGALFDLEDAVDLDQFIKNPSGSKTFLSVAQICGLSPAALAGVRNAGAPERDAYLEAKSALLSAQLGQFWRQESYAFKLAVDGHLLRLHVRDKATGTTTSLTERSDGFRWRTAFFLDISAFLASRSGRSIVLLDNPATELHEEGKGDVLRFIQEAAKSDRIQIVYSTHERALIDPWRTGRIRVASLTREGTKIRTVPAASSNGMLETVMKGIGSPARYSLFGAPRTVSFEGAGDTYIASAANEYLARTRPGAALDKDVYSISSVGGTGKAQYTWQVYRNLGMDFVMVVGRGDQGAGLAKRVGAEEFGRRFVELPPVQGKRGTGIEDLVDRSLYYEAFECTYRHILDAVPAIDEIDGDAAQRRSVNYAGWFKRSDESFDKALVAQRMFSVMLDDGPGGGAPGRAEAIERTGAAFAGLFAAIKERYADRPGAAGEAGEPPGPAAPCHGGE